MDLLYETQICFSKGKYEIYKNGIFLLGIYGKTRICVLKSKSVLVKHKFALYSVQYLCFEKANLLYLKHKFACSKHKFTPKLVKFQNTNIRFRVYPDLLFKTQICVLIKDGFAFQKTNMKYS